MSSTTIRNLASNVIDKGIYHGLPTYPSSTRALKALVFGANGISGHHMLRVLCEDSQRWEQIVALSRRPPVESQSTSKKVRPVQLDLLQNPEKNAKILTDNNLEAQVSWPLTHRTS